MNRVAQSAPSAITQTCLNGRALPSVAPLNRIGARVAGRPRSLDPVEIAQPIRLSDDARLDRITEAGTFHPGVLTPSKIQTLRCHAFDHQHGHCWNCGVHMWLTSPAELPGASPAAVARLQCTAEYLLAPRACGRDIASNVVAACAHCNHTSTSASARRTRQPIDLKSGGASGAVNGTQRGFPRRD